ncbi:HAMP domain-containing sensor histidine kinase [Aureimonas sp. AU22]|uniref:sensor histidine kinase n=1 Tax=Aureimonas sp. AU22 TaxID=1638162 RepID=UPI0007836C21|nr:HAMP domain-containing sensor histidine kinase [Aureimonas sp. AU22]
MAQSRNSREAGRSVDFKMGLIHGLDRLSEMVGASGGAAPIPHDHGRLAAGLIAAGFLSAALSPLALVVPGGAGLLPVLLGSAVVLLALAAAIKAGMEFDLVLVGLHLAGSVMIGVLALVLDSLWPLVLVAVGPVEAWSAGARVRAKLMMPAMLAAFGLTGFLSLHGMGPAGQGLAGYTIALPLCAAYATFVVCRWFYGTRKNTMPMRVETPLAVLDADGMLPARADGAAEPFTQHLHLLDRVVFLHALNDMRAGGPARRIALRLRSQGESFRAVDLALDPVRNASGVLQAIRVVELGGGAASSQSDAADDGRQAAFIATVSHELRTPLNAIVGFADMLDQEMCGRFSDPRQKEYVGLIRRSSEHLLAVVNGLLDMSKIEAGRYELQMAAFAPAEIVSAATEMVQGDADRKGLRLIVRGPAPTETLVADAHACRQILVNLLCNAVKFTDRGTVCLTAARDADWLTFTVSDTGIGIAPDDIARLARPFVQLSQGPSRRYEGTGLGLSLVKGLAELHHGSLHIRSQPDKGTTVTVRIPTDCADRIQAAQTHSENIVALTDARKKTSSLRQDPQARRTA